MSKSKLILLIFSSLLILSFSFFFIKNFRIDASSDTLVAQNDENFKYFNEYSKIFKTNDFLILAVENKKEINIDFVNTIKLISSKLLKIKEVSNVFSFIEAPVLFLNNTKISDLAGNIQNLQNSDYEIKQVINEFKNNPLYVDQIINKEGTVFSIIIYLTKDNNFLKSKDDFKNSLITKNEYLKIKNLNDNKREKLITSIRQIIEEADKNYTYYLGGVEMITNDVINFVKDDILIFSFSVIFIIIIVLLFIFREFIWVGICLISSCYTIITIFGMLGLLQIEVTAVSSNFAALIFILSISMNIHIINYYRLLEANSSNLKKTFLNMFWPCLYTTLTTIVAFASLIITDIKPIIDFGIIMVLSLIISFICSFTVLPLLIFISLSKLKLNRKKYFIRINFQNFTINYSKIITFVSFLLFSISIFGIFKLDVENSFVNYFKKNTEIYKGMKLIDQELGGTTPLDIIINFKEDDDFKNINNSNNLLDDNILEDEEIFDDEIFDDDIFDQNSEKNWFTKDKLNMISLIHQYLEKRDEVGKAQSIYSLIELANLINDRPLDIFELSVLYEEIPDNYKEELIYPYLIIEKNIAKITARVKDSEKIKRKEIIDETYNFILENKNSSVESFKVNGLLVLYTNMLESLFDSQIKSLGFVVILIFLMFIILFQSLKLSILAIIPNIFASSFILGIIGYFSIPLDIMTITIAAITIGIAVDNTIHYLYRLKEFKKNNTMKDSINLTNSSAGLAVITTSTTIALGFSILVLSSFIPTIIFGIFTSMAMIFAMIGVLILLPSLLILTNK